MTDSDQWAERWTPLPAPFSKYEVFSDGFGPDQRPVRRIGSSDPLKTTVGNHGEYLWVKPYDDDGKRQTKSVHSLVLLGFAGECPPRMESRHLDDDPLNNRWRPGSEQEARKAGGNLVYGTKRQQHFDKVANGNPPVVPKAFECVNHARCGGMVANQGSRCLPCAAEVGRQAAAMLGARTNLRVATKRLGYKSPRWVHGLARDHGGYTGTMAEALAQRPPWTRRVTATVGYRLGLGAPSRRGGDAQ